MTNHHLPFFKLSLQSHSIAEGSACPIKMAFQPQWTVENPVHASENGTLLSSPWKSGGFVEMRLISDVENWVVLLFYYLRYAMQALCLNDANWHNDSSLYFHLARYTQIALRCNVRQSHTEGTESANVCVFSYKKVPLAFSDLSFLKKTALLWSHGSAWVGRGVVSRRIWSFEEAHRFSGFKDIFWRATKPLLGLPACS